MASARPPHDLPRLPSRRRDASKHDHGRVVVVGGATGMAGAPALTASAALRSGAGLVELLVPESVAPVAAGFDPCVMTTGLAATEQGTFAPAAADVLHARLARADAAAIGPGMGRTESVRGLVRRAWRELECPAVFDADALWALAGAGAALAAHAGPRVLTPHAGEMRRLLGREPTGAADADRALLEQAAGELAAAADVVLVLKGPGTLVADATRRAHNETGNPGMATAGTGDVLAGVIAALLAQGLEPFAAARLGAWVHGRAGDAAAADLGAVSMTARDLLERLPVGFRAAAAQ